MNVVIKEFLRKVITILPPYKKTYQNLLGSKSNNIDLQKVVRRAIQKVPFYKDYKKYLTSSAFTISSLPIIRKKDIMEQSFLMIDSTKLKIFLSRVETGGSTGCSLTIFRNWKENVMNQAYVDYLYTLLGKDLIFGELRGRKPSCGIVQKIASDRYLLSSYLLNASTLDSYLRVLNENKINAIHAYPSSLVVLARLIKNAKRSSSVKGIVGILTSSEIFAKEDKKLVKEVFVNARIIDFYGHNERACCAYAIDDGFYNFFPDYGHVEFIDTGEKINGNRIAEIVATSIMSTTMPLIRYATDDYVEIDREGNVVSVIGRTSDFIVNKLNEIAPCIVCTRTESMQNVLNFQYYQPREGVLIFRIIVNEYHTERERMLLLEDMHTTFGTTMDCSVVVVSEVEKTKIGKQKRLVQDLDICKYK